MHLIDLVVIVAYLAGTVLFGAWFSRSQKDVKDYFVGGRSVPWWAIMGSIVATETSTVTFISVPGVAFTGNWTFLQLVMGYMVGRIVVSIIFVPAYFRGELLTVYQILGVRFGSGVKRLAAGLFLVTRSLADGFRLFATGLVLAALLIAMPGMAETARAWVPGLDPAVTIVVKPITITDATTMVVAGSSPGTHALAVSAIPGMASRSAASTSPVAKSLTPSARLRVARKRPAASRLTAGPKRTPRIW